MREVNYKTYMREVSYKIYTREVSYKTYTREVSYKTHLGTVALSIQKIDDKLVQTSNNDMREVEREYYEDVVSLNIGSLTDELKDETCRVQLTIVTDIYCMVEYNSL